MLFRNHDTRFEWEYNCTMGSKEKNRRYTCADYREEMTLLSLKRRLSGEQLSDKERRKLLSEIRRLESEMNLD
jgi:hypothetical protein